MKPPEIGSKWVSIVGYPGGADVRVGDIVKVKSNAPYTITYVDKDGKKWFAGLNVFHDNFAPLYNEKDPQPEQDRGSKVKELVGDVEVDLEKSLEEQYDDLDKALEETYDNVNHPSHYGQGNIEAIEYIEDFLTTEEYIGYLRGNIAKYLHRFRYKNGKEDLKKAQWYLDRLIGVFKNDL